jgi:ribonucleoside-diphosphate reductase alpha chain
MGPEVQFCDDLHAMKYRQDGETFRDSVNRVARALADLDSAKHYHGLRDALLTMRFLPAGRIQSAMGGSRDVTPYNCYVAGTIPDSYTQRDNPENSSIMDRAWEAAQTMRMGGGIGYDFSTLRPRGDMIRKLQSRSSGPISFMHIFDAVCKATSSAGHRRGAQMGVLRVDHPDIMEFVGAKHDQHTLSGFNVSVAVTDEFMAAVARGSDFTLRWGGQNYQTVDARELWETIMRSTWDWAEPGVLFIDTINRMNNLWYCEKIAATNPCGEQPLPPHGACLLGSFNLVQYLCPLSGHAKKQIWGFDWDQLVEDIPHVVRGMDNVVDRARYPLDQQGEEARSKRRMGLGITGLANAAETMGMPYGSPDFLEFEERVLATICRHSYRASALLAKEKGSFPLYDAERYLASQFIQTLDDETRELIEKHGIRNSHLTSIAPTGTISMTADNVSSSIEPVFSLETQRPVNTPDGPVIVTLRDYAYDRFGTRAKVSADVTAKEHVAVLTTAARLVDSAVSKTVNCDGTMPWADFVEIYKMAWEQGAKGTTTFNADGRRFALLTGKTERTPEQETVTPEVVGESCTIDLATGRKSCE